MLATLLPDTWFQGPPTLVLLAIAAVAMVIVIKGADWLVEGAAGIAKRLGMPEVVIGATIVSLGTTSPEMAVSVLAAFGGNAGLALGNGVGSIIADTGLILGLGLLLTRLPADRFVLNRQGWVQFGSGALLAGFCYALYAVHGQAVDANGTPLARIDRWVGIILVLLLVGYMAISVRWARQHPSGEPHLVAEPTGEVHTDHLKPADRGLIGLAAMGLLGLALVVFAGDGLVQSVTVVAERWGVPDVVIASTLVALGTNLRDPQGPPRAAGRQRHRGRHPQRAVRHRLLGAGRGAADPRLRHAARAGPVPGGLPPAPAPDHAADARLRPAVHLQGRAHRTLRPLDGCAVGPHVRRVCRRQRMSGVSMI